MSSLPKPNNPKNRTSYIQIYAEVQRLKKDKEILSALARISVEAFLAISDGTITNLTEARCIAGHTAERFLGNPPIKAPEQPADQPAEKTADAPSEQYQPEDEVTP